MSGTPRTSRGRRRGWPDQGEPSRGQSGSLVSIRFSVFMRAWHSAAPSRSSCRVIAYRTAFRPARDRRSSGASFRHAPCGSGTCRRSDVHARQRLHVRQRPQSRRWSRRVEHAVSRPEVHHRTQSPAPERSQFGATATSRPPRAADTIDHPPHRSAVAPGRRLRPASRGRSPPPVTHR